MKRSYILCVSMLLVTGILFPIKSTGEGKSPFFQEIKRFFHYGSQYPKAESKTQAPTQFEGKVQEVLRYPAPEKVK